MYTLWVMPWLPRTRNSTPCVFMYSDLFEP